jgi:hypothetical protein
MPDELPGRLLDAGLGVEHVGLIAAAYAESSRNALDGRLARSRARSIRGWTKRREMDLIIANVLRVDGTDLVLVDYLTVNKSRRQIEELREARAAAGSAGGTTTASAMPRLGGRFSDGCPVHRTRWERSKHPGGGHFCPARAKPGQVATRSGYCALTPSAPPDAPPNAGGRVDIADDAPLGPVHAQDTKQPTKHLLGTDNDSNNNTSVVAVDDAGPDGPGGVVCAGCDKPFDPGEMVMEDAERRRYHDGPCLPMHLDVRAVLVPR